MPVDFITTPAAVLGLILICARLSVLRHKTLPGFIRVLHWVLFAPIILIVVIPLVVLQTRSFLGNTDAMIELSRSFQTGFGGRFFDSDRLALHYCDEAIARGSVEAMNRKSALLEFHLTVPWHNAHGDAFIGDPGSPIYKSAEWTESFELAKRAAATGSLRGTHRVHRMSLMPDPRAYGEGVYLVERAQNDSKKLYVDGSSEYHEHLRKSDGWRRGMRILSEESSDTWVRDFYFIALLSESAASGDEACRLLENAVYRHSDVDPLGVERRQRSKMVNEDDWKSGVQLLEANARSGNAAAADILGRAQEFAAR